MVSILRSEFGYTLGHTVLSNLQCVHEIAEKWVISTPNSTMTFSKNWYSHEKIDEIYNNLIGDFLV